MNNSELIGLITQVVTAFTTVVALLLVIRQMRQLDETLRSQVYQGLIDNSLKIDELLIEYPEFRKYIYRHAPIDDENSPDFERLMGIMDFSIDIVDNVKAQEKFIPKKELPGWNKFTEDVLSSPAAAVNLKKHGHWFTGGIPEILESSNKLSISQKARHFISKYPSLLKFNRSWKSLVRSYIAPKIVIRKSNIHGLGMYANEDIKEGEIVFIKGGHILTKQELYSSDKIESYLPLSDDYFLGSKRKKEEMGIKLFVNHSCEPNCGMRGEITFVAMRNICKDEELTCDYAMIDNEDYSFKCKCGVVSCRKEITGFDWKDKNLQQKYSHYFARYLLDKINSA